MNPENKSQIELIKTFGHRIERTKNYLTHIKNKWNFSVPFWVTKYEPKICNPRKIHFCGDKEPTNVFDKVLTPAFHLEFSSKEEIEEFLKEL